MLSRYHLTGAALVVLVGLSACGPKASSTVPVTAPAHTDAQAPANPVITDVSFARAAVTSRFRAARNKRLSVNDMDAYIDSSVAGNDRVLARKFMAYMPPNLRDDFVYLAPDGHLVTNNPAILSYAKVTHGINPPVAPPAIPESRTAAPASGTRRPKDYSDNCSPPNPPNSPGGAYVRMVSYCGFTAGWGFVTIPPGTSYMPYDVANARYNDNGFAYFEIQAPSSPPQFYGTTTEGGFEYYNDQSIAPYARSSAPEYRFTNAGYVNITGGQNRYNAGDLLFLTHGLTADKKYVYVCAGKSPPGLNPHQAWVSSQIFQPQNAGWFFLDASPDMSGAPTSVNAASQNSPCIGCSVSKVVSIAQRNTSTWQVDGSFFGVVGNTSAIMWQQVAFGVYLANCTKGTSLCTFQASANPARYYGGAQYYPYQGVAQTHPYPSGYGPYQSFDSINLSGQSGFDSARTPAGAFDDPLPPVCTPDSYGYCVAMTIGAPLQLQNVVCMAGGYTAAMDMWTGQQSWYIQGPGQVLMYYSETGVDPNGAAPNCGDPPYWDPAEPSAAFGDPNLP